MLSQAHKTYWSQWNRLTISEGILYRKWEDTHSSEITQQYILPADYRNQILTRLHNDLSAGHLGFNHTVARVRHRFYWAGYTKFIEDGVSVAQNVKRGTNLPGKIEVK